MKLWKTMLCRLGCGTFWMGQAEESLKYCKYASWHSSSKPRSGKGIEPKSGISRWDTPTGKLGKTLSRMASRQNRFKIKFLINKDSKAQDLIVDTVGSVTKDQSWRGLTVKQGTTAIHKVSASYAVSNSSLTMEVEAVTLCPPLDWLCPTR